jgi:exonuclease III
MKKGVIYLSIITLNVNGLSSPIKRLAKWIIKQNSTGFCLQKNLVSLAKMHAD